MKQALLPILIPIIGVLALAGCAAKTATPGVAETPGAGKPITISFMSWESDSAKKLEEDAIVNYMADHPGVTIEPQFVGDGDYLAKLNTLLAANSAPDVFKVNEFLTLQYGMENLVENLTPFYNAVGIDPAKKYAAGTVAISEGECYGVGKDAASIMMFYNKPLFAKYGVKTPPLTAATAWSWDEFVSVAEQLTIDTNGNNAASPDFDKTSVATYGTLLDAAGWLLDMPLLYSNGGSFVNADGTASALTTPETKEVYNRLYDLIERGIAPAPALKSGLPSSAAMMLADQVAMYWTGGWEAGSLKDGNVDYGIAVMPKMKDAVTISWSAHLCVSSKTPDKQASFDFLHWFIDPETNPLVLAQGVPSSIEYMQKHPDALFDFYGEENAKVIIEALNSAVTPENVTVKNFSQIADQQFRPGMEKAWYGESTVDDALKQIEDACIAADLFQGRWDK